MAVDKRELILVQLEAILNGVAELETVVRNRDNLETDELPAAYLFDGDEEADTAIQGRGRLAASPNLITMTPEICIVLKPRHPPQAGMGPELNAWRVSVVKLVMNDSALQALVGANGAVFYKGMVSDMGKDRSMQGQVVLQFAIRYVLRPSDL